MAHEILVTVEGGLIQAIDNIPPDVVVKVMDFDTEGVDEQYLSEKDRGEKCVISTWGDETPVDGSAT
ncbi:MAG: hypothetical protein AMXMBFR13_06780 [Phycisphaerae bacterium]